MNTLDVRALPPRKRHERLFESIDALETGDTLRLVNDHDPLPVRYPLDATRPGQVVWQSVESGPQQWAVDITSRARVVDARPMLARREEPFAMIMDPVTTLRDDEVLVVYAPSNQYRSKGCSRTRASTTSPTRSRATSGVSRLCADERARAKADGSWGISAPKNDRRWRRCRRSTSN